MTTGRLASGWLRLVLQNWLLSAVNSRGAVSPEMRATASRTPVVIFQFALSPYEDWQQLAWTGALLITLSVLTLSVFARMLTAKKAK